jgi:hypothetical protein
MGLHEIFLSTHDGRPPPTYNRGRDAIDAIYVTTSLRGSRCGYLAFGDAVPSDHRALWIDVPYTVAFGHVLPPVVSARARRLKSAIASWIGHLHFNKSAVTHFLLPTRRNGRQLTISGFKA